MRALVVGGTRGIGKATADLMRERGWEVEAVGRKGWREASCREGAYDIIIWAAADITSLYEHAFALVVDFYCWVPLMLEDGGLAVAISSIAADKPARVNPHYAAAKAALESYARSLADSDDARKHKWEIRVIRFDLVDTDMARQLPAETLTGRTAISAQEAAQQIMEIVDGHLRKSD